MKRTRNEAANQRIHLSYISAKLRQIFEGWNGVRALATLRAFPLPCDLQGLSADEVYRRVAQTGHETVRRCKRQSRSVRLLSCAARSIGYRSALDEARRDLKFPRRNCRKAFTDWERSPLGPFRGRPEISAITGMDGSSCDATG